MVSIIDWLRGIFRRRKPKPKELAKPKKRPRTKSRKKSIVKYRPKKIKSKIKRRSSRPKKVKIKTKPKIKFPSSFFEKIEKLIAWKPAPEKKKISVPKEVIKEVVVADIMTKNPIVVDVNDTLNFVMRLFADKKISGAPVLRDENFVGVISESDIIKTIGKKKMLGQQSGLKKLDELKVGEVMHGNPLSVHEYTKLSDAVDLMNKNDITRLIVLNDKRKVIGIVTRSDIIRGASKELLYNILKREPREERLRSMIDTDIDEILKIVERKGSIGIDEVKKRLLVPEDKVEEWGKILEAHGLLELIYPAVGKPRLRKKIR